LVGNSDPVSVERKPIGGEKRKEKKGMMRKMKRKEERRKEKVAKRK
jgi:hypothetical protein